MATFGVAPQQQNAPQPNVPAPFVRGDIAFFREIPTGMLLTRYEKYSREDWFLYFWKEAISSWESSSFDDQNKFVVFLNTAFEKTARWPANRGQ